MANDFENSSIQADFCNFKFYNPKNLILEPIGKSAPKFTTDSRSHTFYREKGTPTALLCAAQGAPIPSTRLNDLL